MMKQKRFLTAQWLRLIMANYEVDPAMLQPFVPAKTELDTWNGRTYVSLVGFLFHDTRVLGIRVPFHITFPEVNLRFYVRYKENDEVKRGVVKIRPMLIPVLNRKFDYSTSLPYEIQLLLKKLFL